MDSRHSKKCWQHCCFSNLQSQDTVLGPTAAIAAAASQRHNRPEPLPRPTARQRPRSRTTQAAAPSPRCLLGSVVLDAALLDPFAAYRTTFPRRQGERSVRRLRHALGFRQSRGLLLSIPSPRPGGLGKKRGRRKRRGCCLRHSPTILEATRRERRSPTHARPAFLVRAGPELSHSALPPHAW